MDVPGFEQEQDAVELLLGCELFGGAADAVPTAGERRAFLRQLTLVEVPAGAVLYQQGEPGDSLWLVAAGAVAVTRATPGGDVLELNHAGPGEAFGELGLLAPSPRTGTATAGAASRLLALRRPLFRQLLGDRDPAAEALLRALTRRVCRRLRGVDARIALVSDLRRGASPEQLHARLAELPSSRGPA